MEKLRNATLVFLIRKSGKKIVKICLAMKKRGFGIHKWNGVGGKVDDQESLEEGAERETKEEIGVSVKELSKVATLSFSFLHNPAWNQTVHVYFSEKWDGEPVESDEMTPRWFSIKKLPFQDMWTDDKYWLPEVIKGNVLQATFKFGDDNILLEKNITTIGTL